MIFVTTYRVKPFLPKNEFRELMTVFASVGPPAGTQAHYVAADGGGGVVISESADALEGFRNILNYTPWVEYETKPMLSIDEAVPAIAEALA